MTPFNYHHLYYFWAVAKNGHLTRVAKQLRVSQSAVSSQIKQLEDEFGQALFLREGRQLRLTEAGRIALNFAEDIFASGQELAGVLREGRSRQRKVLRIGSVATLSRNFQEAFIKPILFEPDLDLVLQSGSLGELLTRLSAHSLDLVLSNRRVQSDVENAWRCRRIARQQVSLVGKPRGRKHRFCFPDDLADVALLLPSRDSEIRAGFDLMCEQLNLRVKVLAEVDDMAMLRLLARDMDGVALLPKVVVRDEIASRLLEEYAVVPNLYESFYSIHVQRRYQPSLLNKLLSQKVDDVLGT